MTTITKLHTTPPLTTMTAALSYCKHTGVKLAISTTFANCPTAHKHNIVALEHPIFGLALPVRYAIYSESKTPTERHVAMVAILVGLEVLDTTRQPVMLESHEVDALHLQFREFLNLTSALIHDSKKLAAMRLPMLRTGRDTPVNGERIKTHIDWCGEIVEASEAGYFATRIKMEGRRTGYDVDQVLDLYDSADDERALVAMLSAKPSKTITASRGKLNGWAMKSIKRNTEYSQDQLDFIKYHMHTTSDQLLVDNLRSAIKLTKAGLTYEDYEREQSLLVIRMLESKLEEVLEVEQSYGFVDLEDMETSNDSATITYTTKTKAVPRGLATLGTNNAGALAGKPTSLAMAAVQKGDSALGRLIARRKAKAAEATAKASTGSTESTESSIGEQQSNES